MSVRVRTLRTTILGAALAAVLVVPAPSAVAATRTWSGATNTDWETPANWGGVTPLAADIAAIPGAPANQPSVTANTAVATDVRLGSTATSATLSISGSGKITSTNGYVGYLAGSTGTATISGTGASWANGTSLRVGESGTGILTISNGGSATDGTGYIGNGASSTGTATVTGTGSSWTSSANFRVGGSGTGTLNIQNGGSVSNVIGYLAFGATGVGTATVDGTGSTWTNSSDLRIANAAGTTGTLTIQNGGHVSNAIGSLAFGTGTTATATVTGTGSSWTNAGSLSIGLSGTGTLNIQNGGTVTSILSYMGYNAGTTGIATVDGTGSSWTASGDLRVGQSGTGTLNVQNGGTASSTANATMVGNVSGSNGTLNIQSGGSVSNVIGYIGYLAGSTGTATVTGSGSSWTSSSDLRVGNSGTGTLNIQSGGTVSNVGVGYIGYVSGSVGTATVSGTGSSWVNSGTFRVGSAGTGTLTVSNGGTVSDVNGRIAQGVGSHGTALITGSGSTWHNTSTFHVGQGDVGILMVQDGGSVIVDSGTSAIGNGSTGIGTATITGTGSNLTIGGIFYVANFGTGTLNIIDGGSVSNTDIGYIGAEVASAGTATVTGIGSSWLNGSELRVGNLGTGTLTIAAGGAVSAGSGTGNVSIASQSGSVGTLNIGAAVGSAAAAPGTLTASTLTFGAGTGSLNFNHTSSTYSFAPVITGTGTINAYAGTTTLSGDLSGFTGAVNLLGGLINYTFASGSTISGVFSGGGALTINAGGTTYLTSNSSAFTGGTTVQSGSTLSVNGSLGGTLEVTPGGTLKGTGTVGAITADAGGTVAPGNSIGTLTMASLTTAPGSTYEAEVAGNGSSDLIHATGTATLGGGTVVVQADAGPYRPGISYTILTADGGVTGTFDNATLSPTYLFLQPRLSYDSSNVYAHIERNAVAFASVAGSINQRATATALDSMTNSSNSAYIAVANMRDVASARAAYDQLSGEPYAGTQSALLGEQHLLRDVLLARLGEIGSRSTLVQPFRVSAVGSNLTGMVPASNSSSNPSGIWLQGFGDWSTLDGNNNSASVTDHSRGVMMGADADMGEQWQGGMAAGTSISRIDTAGRNANVTSHNYHAALYAGTRNATGPTVRLGSSATLHDIDSQRTVSFSGFSSEAQEVNYGSMTVQGFVDLSYPVRMKGIAAGKDGDITTLAPFVTLASLYQTTDGIHEQGGAAALDVDDSYDALLTSTLGLRLHRRLLLPQRDIKRAALDGSLGWAHAQGDVTPQRIARFAAGSDAFTVAGAPIASNALVYATSLALDLDPNASLGIHYGGQLASDAHNQTLMGSFRYAF